MLETDPLDIALDDDGDLDVLRAAATDLVAGLEGIAQLCRIAVLTFMGEWFANLDEGVDYFGLILGQPFRENVIRAEFRRVLLTVPGVTEVLSVVTTFDAATRVLSVNWRTRTVFGDTPVDTLTQVV
jgi:hypothetical protein